MTDPSVPHQPHQGWAAGLAAKVLGAEARSWGAPDADPSMHQLYTDPSDERLVVAVASAQPPGAVDEALATGLAVQGDRDLHVVLPDDEREERGDVERVWEATWARLPFVCTPVYLWVHAAGGVTAKPAPSKATAIARTRHDNIVPTADDGDVGERGSSLHTWLATPPDRDALGLATVLHAVPTTSPSRRHAVGGRLGLDRYGHIHVIEATFGRDRMLGLQALDSWVWAVEHRAELVTLLRSAGADVADEPRILLDVVVGDQEDDETIPDVRLLLPQLEALDGQVSWRVGFVHGWRDVEATPRVDWHRRGASPPAGLRRAASPRFAWRMDAHLREHATARRESTRPPFLDTVEAAVIPSAQPALQAVRAAGDAHRYLHHVRSSQAFALNLFGGLTEAQVVEVASHIDPSIVACEPPAFEYTDPNDDLREATETSPHATQIDVRLDGRTDDGERHVLLIEVKLSEDGFGGCSAAEAPANDRADLCATAAPFGGDIDGCFQLRNQDREHRRRYDQYLPVSEVGVGNHGCPYRELNQPMRNAALARVLVARGEADRATVVLCAHDDHDVVWRRWAEAQQAIPWDDRHRPADLPASVLVAVREPEARRELEDRYRLTGPGLDH